MPALLQRTQKLRNCFIVCARFAIGTIFLLGGMAKLRQPYDFLFAVYQYDVVGDRAGQFVSILSPGLEIVAAICLLVGVALPGAFLLTGALSLMFIVVQALTLARGMSIPCGCFGLAAASEVGVMTVMTAVALHVASILALACALLSRKERLTTQEQQPTAGANLRRA